MRRSHINLRKPIVTAQGKKYLRIYISSKIIQGKCSARCRLQKQVQLIRKMSKSKKLVFQMTHIKNRSAIVLKYAISVGVCSIHKTISLDLRFVVLWNTWHQRCFRMSPMTTLQIFGASAFFYMNFTMVTLLSREKIRLKFHKKLQSVKFVLALHANQIIKTSSINYCSMSPTDVYH